MAQRYIFRRLMDKNPFNSKSNSRSIDDSDDEFLFEMPFVTNKNLSFPEEDPKNEATPLTTDSPTNTNTQSPPRILDFLQTVDPSDAYKEVGPRVYEIKSSGKKIESFYVFGCQGSAKPSQHEMATLMNNIIAQTPDDRPSFVLVLGDNIYDWGPSSATDKGFKDCFDNVYGNPQLTYLNQLPFFMLLGNHDGNYQKYVNAILSSNPIGEETEKWEVIHTYLDNPEEKMELYKQQTLETGKLPQWNMPYFYYSVILSGVQIFCLDSNTIAKDYLEYKKGIKHPNKPNQFEWFKTEYEKATLAGRKIAFAEHHPRYTSGKRSIPAEYDSGHYLSGSEISELQKELQTTTASYNGLIAAIYQKEGLDSDIDFVAHDHFCSYYNERENTQDRKKLCQLTAGGGGGDLQSRATFVKHPYVAYHLKQTGFSKISFDAQNPKELHIDTYTTNGHHLHFTDQSKEAIYEKSNDQQLEALRSQMLKLADSYLATRKHKDEKEGLTKETPSHPQSSGLVSGFFGAINTTMHHVNKFWKTDKNLMNEIVCVHDLIAYFNQPKLSTFDDAVAAIQRFTKSLYLGPNEELLSSKIEKVLAEKFNRSITPQNESNLNTRSNSSPSTRLSMTSTLN